MRLLQRRKHGIKAAAKEKTLISLMTLTKILTKFKDLKELI